MLDQVSLGNTLALAASFAYVGSENRESSNECCKNHC